MPASPTSERLDAAALDALFLRLERPVYNVVYRWLWNAQDSQEVVQEAFVRLWDMRARVRMQTVEPLVYKIALNLASKRARRRKRWAWWTGDSRVDALPDDQPEASQQLDAHARDLRVRRAVESLPDKLREVVVLCEFSGMSYAKVGAALGIPEGTVGSRRHAAFTRLRRSLKC